MSAPVSEPISPPVSPPIAFAGLELDSCEHDRDPTTLDVAAREDAARLVLFHKGLPGARLDGTLHTQHPSEAAGMALSDPGLVFLGRDVDGAPVFAAATQSDDALPPQMWADLRRLASLAPAGDLALAGRARSLLDWHRTHGFCARCGGRTDSAKGGLLRVCQECEAEHYPRINPVAIMLVEYTDDRGGDLLLGRQKNWPPGSFSALAGFVSPGETLEECCRREVFEEAGVQVGAVRYLFSQPWPFPSQLMLGLAAEATSRELTVDRSELETAQWFSRAEVEAVWDKTGNAFVRPPRFTIAHQLIRAWLGR